MPKENKPVYTSFDALRDELQSVYYHKLSAEPTPKALPVKKPSRPRQANRKQPKQRLATA